MLGSCVTEAAQDVGSLHHRGGGSLSSSSSGSVAAPNLHLHQHVVHHHLRGPQGGHLANNVNNQNHHLHPQMISSYSPHHPQPHLQQQQQQSLHHQLQQQQHYSPGAASMPLSQHQAAQTSQHNMRGGSSCSPSSSSSSYMDSVGYAASPPSSSGSSPSSTTSTTMAPPPLLPLPASLSMRHHHPHHHQSQQQQHPHQPQQQQQQTTTDEATNAGFLQQLLHGGIPTDEELEHVSVGGASLSLMAATYHGQPQHHQQQHQPQLQSQQQHSAPMQMSASYGSVHPHSHSHNPTPASTGTPTNSSEELPCIFDELDMFQENPNSLVSPSCFTHPAASVPPQHHHAGAMEPGSGANNSLQLLTITSATPSSDGMALADELVRDGGNVGRRRKLDDLYEQNSNGASSMMMNSNGDMEGVSQGRRGSHPGHGAKRIRYNRSRSASCSSAASAVKPEPADFAALSSSSSASSPAVGSESNRIDLEDIYVGVRDQVVYWGNSKNKYDVTVCVRAPTRFSGMLKGATISYQVSLPAMQEFKMKSRSNAKGKGKPKADRDVKRAVLQPVRTESDNGMVEFEAFLKNCLPTEKLSNLTLLELHFNIIPKHALGKGEDIKGSLNLASRGRGGRKQSIGGDDDDFEDEDDGRESLNDDEDEYVPARNGRARGGRGKGRGGQRSKQQRADEERESDDQAGGVMDYHNGANEMFADVSSVTVIERKVPVVTYTHSKAITRALCRLIWYPMNEENTMSTDFLLEKLCKYFASQLQLPISIYDRHNLAAMLSPFTDGITYVEFYSLLGEWFVLAIKMAKKKTQCLWQQGRETFIPLLFNPYRRISDNPSNNNNGGSSSASTSGGGGGDDDEWTEDNEASESTRRNGRGRGRRSRSGSRAGLHSMLPAGNNNKSSIEDSLSGAADVIAALQLDSVLEREGDFLVTIGPDLKERHGRAEGEEGRGVNYFPSLKYPLQIVYVKEGGEKQCLSVENKLDKLTDFIHAKHCLRDYLVLQRDGAWKRVEKDKFAFNHAQQRRLEETLGRTSVLSREDTESLSYAHA